jgi:hypothetical protein
MRLDIKLPLGLIFSIIGIILICSGLFYEKEILAKLQFNFNLWWGALVFLFGFLMLILFFRSKKVSVGTEDE